MRACRFGSPTGLFCFADSAGGFTSSTGNRRPANHCATRNIPAQRSHTRRRPAHPAGARRRRRPGPACTPLRRGSLRGCRPADTASRWAGTAPQNPPPGRGPPLRPPAPPAARRSCFSAAQTARPAWEAGRRCCPCPPWREPHPAGCPAPAAPPADSAAGWAAGVRAPEHAPAHPGPAPAAHGQAAGRSPPAACRPPAAAPTES